MGLAPAGIVVGLMGAVRLTGLMAGRLIGASAYAPGTFAAMALAACYFPARRAVRMEPMAALCAE
jgi:putative ABC transport system permease protein